MADDSIYIPDPIDMHPCDTPRGMTYYDLDILTPYQKDMLNQLKRDTIREDEKYLAAHPEIRAIVSMIYKKILRKRPKLDVHIHVASIFTQTKQELQKEIDSYVASRADHKYEGDSAVNLLLEERLRKAAIEEEMAQLMSFLSKDVFENLFERVFDIIGPQLDEVDIKSYESVVTSTLAGSLFDIFSKTSTISNTAQKQKAIQDLIEHEIVNRMDEFANIIANVYSGVNLDRVRLYRKKSLDAISGSSYDIPYASEELGEGGLLEEGDILEDMGQLGEEIAIGDEEMEEEEQAQPTDDASEPTDFQESFTPTKPPSVVQVDAREELLSRRARLLAKQQEDNPFLLDATANAEAEEKAKEAEKKEAAPEAPAGLNPELAKFASGRKGRGPDADEPSPGPPGLNPDLAKMAGGRRGRGPDSDNEEPSPGPPGLNPDLAKMAGGRRGRGPDSDAEESSPGPPGLNPELAKFAAGKKGRAPEPDGDDEPRRRAHF